MSIMKRALTRPVIQTAVKNTHNNIRVTENAELAKFGVRHATLLDYLPLTVSLRPLNATPAQFQSIKQVMLNAACPRFNTFHVYNMPEVGMNEARWKFVQTVTTAGKVSLLTKPKPTAKEINDLSTYTKSPTTLLAIKYFCLSEDYNEDEFDAYPAMTDPVRDFTKFFLGNDYRDTAKAHGFTQQLANEVGLNQLNVNTALWVLGCRM